MAIGSAAPAGVLVAESVEEEAIVVGIFAVGAGEEEKFVVAGLKPWDMVRCV